MELEILAQVQAGLIDATTAEHLHLLKDIAGLLLVHVLLSSCKVAVDLQIHVPDMALVLAGETIEAGDSIRNKFLQAVYEQISQNLDGGGVAQGSNFWNLYTVGVGSDDPYQITLADTSTMAVVAAQVRAKFEAASFAL